MSLELRLYYTNGSSEVCQYITKLLFKKDCFSPGTELRGRFIRKTDLFSVSRMTLTVEGHLVHDGYIEYIENEWQRGAFFISFVSRSWSSLLSQNEPVPGMNYHMTLDRLLRVNTPIPHVTCESGTSEVNYISVKEHSTIWDAVSAYAMKAYSTQPYISGTNCVSVTRTAGTAREYTRDLIVTYGQSCDRRSMLSKVYMEDVDGHYSISVVNPAAAPLEIVREKYFALDRQWLASPETGLQMRIGRAERRAKVDYARVLGYRGEELFDSFSLILPGQTITGSVGGIELEIEYDRIVTKLLCMRQ